MIPTVPAKVTSINSQRFGNLLPLYAIQVRHSSKPALKLLTHTGR